jgi:hypothetical protein
MAAWPSTLPAPSGPGYSIKPISQTTKTDMEAGSSRTRRRFSARNDKVNLSWEMTDEQLAIFRTWFDGEAGGGAAWFTTSLLLGKGGFTTEEAKFVGSYTTSYTGYMSHTVTAELEIR